MLFLSVAIAGSSALFGEAGEQWERPGRLPDFSWAGYRAGDPLPQVPTVARASELGIPADGTDATVAIQAALDGMEEGALLLEAGTYTVAGVLTLSRTGIVLRGEGPQTVLELPFSLAELRGPEEHWSWNGGLIEVQGPGVGDALTPVGEAARGATRLAVTDATGLAPGALVVLELTDADGSFARHLHAELAEGGDCSWQPLGRTFQWPVRIEAVEEGAVVLQQPLRFDVRAGWSPHLRAAPFLEGVGIEHLTMRFADVPYAGHLNEPGYNGIFVRGGAVDGWIRDVTFVNADNGVLLDTLTKHWTVEGVVLEGRRGHHGYNIAHTADVLIQDWVQRTDFVHGATVDHRTSGTVFRRGTADGVTMHLDHHRDAPFENLFTTIDGPTSFFHGGSACAGLPSGARTTAWGLTEPVVPPWFGTVQTNVVGRLQTSAPRVEDPIGAWFEHVDDLQPTDLYQAQRDLRLGLLAGQPTDTEPARPGCGCAGNATGAGSEGMLAWLRRR